MTGERPSSSHRSLQTARFTGTLCLHQLILGATRHKKPHHNTALLHTTACLLLHLACSDGALPVRGSVEGEALRGARPRRGCRREGQWLRVRDYGRRRDGGGGEGGGGCSSGGGSRGLGTRSGRSGRVRRHADAADMAEEGADGRQVPAAAVQRHDTLRRERPAGVQRRPGQSPRPGEACGGDLSAKGHALVSQLDGCSWLDGAACFLFVRGASQLGNKILRTCCSVIDSSVELQILDSSQAEAELNLFKDRARDAPAYTISSVLAPSA